VRILLDENIPVGFAAELIGHDVDTVTGVGWAGVKNGKLLSLASETYDAFVTMDRSIEHQQDVSELPFGIVVLRAPSNRLLHLRPLAPAILAVLAELAPGRLQQVGA
jgi:hypothetical protein